uniref:Protein midgut expression 1-like n=1 Tax=Drosophila rhopaloa TaxID=1041015 RepID=A0A6P4DW66_DRORH
MCLPIIGSALCCCCKLGLKCLCFFAFSAFGVLLIVALVVYFCFFYNKSEETTKIDFDSTMGTTALEDNIQTTVAPSLVRSFLHQLIDRI